MDPTTDAMTRPSHPDARALTMAYGLLLITMVIWASAFAGLRRVLQETDALSLTTARMLIAALSLVIAGALAGVKMPRREDLSLITVAGLSGFTLYHAALNLGLEHVTAGQASFIAATTPLWTAVLAWKYLGERLTGAGLLGLVLSVAGVGYLSLEQGDVAFEGGALLVLSAAVAAAVNLAIQKRLLERYNPLEVSVHVTAFGALPFLFYLPFCVDALGGLSHEAWGVTLWLGVGPIGLGYVLSTIALKLLPATRSAQMMLLMPPIAALIAWLWIGEQPQLRLLIGGAMILAGVSLGGIRGRSLDEQPARDLVGDPALEAAE